MNLSARSLIRHQVKEACELLEHTFLQIPSEDLHHPLKGGRSAAWHVMHCATWVSIVGESYKARLEPYVYATSLKPEHEPSIPDIWSTLTTSKNRSLQHLDKLTEDDLDETILPPFPVMKSGQNSPISRLKLWTWLPHFLDFQRGFLAGQLQIDPHLRRIEEFL